MLGVCIGSCHPLVLTVLRRHLAAVDTKPPKAMILGQKCRDRARKEMAQLAYTQVILNEFTAGNGGSARATPRGRSTQSARSQRFAQSQVDLHSLSNGISPPFSSADFVSSSFAKHRICSSNHPDNEHERLDAEPQPEGRAGRWQHRPEVIWRVNSCSAPHSFSNWLF